MNVESSVIDLIFFDMNSESSNMNSESSDMNLESPDMNLE